MRIKTFTAVLTAVMTVMMTMPAVPAYSEEAPAAELLDISQFTVREENIVHLGAGYLRDVSYLFDDQDKVPASLDSMKVDAETFAATSRSNWTPNQQMEYGAASFYIDFGANYVITGAALLDTNGTPVWTISDGEPFAWNTVATQTMDWYNSWRAIKFDDPRPTRYLHFSSDYCDTGVSELALYGYKVSELTEEQKAKTAPKSSAKSVKLTAGQTAGSNVFIDDPMTAMMALGNAREYHNFSWLLDSSGKVKFTQGTWGDMDSFYSTMKDRGISIIPCFQGGSTVISGGEKANEIPVPAGADTLDPESYAVHAQAMYQVAARYGSNKDIDLSTLNITDAQEPKVGMGLLDALENCNEPNKSWAGKANYFTPYELAAMCSADYDGHEGTIPNAGVKTADPDFRLAVGGLLSPESTLIEYLDEMKLWFDYNRSDGKFAVDIINVHMGPGTYNVEDSDFRSRVRELKEWIAKNAPGAELWISEFEIPMGDCEQEGVDAHDDENYQTKYAQRVARTYLAAMAEGVDRMTKFQLRDEGEGVYYNSGLVTGKGEWSKKKAWYYLSCMTNVLKNADFKSETISDGVEMLEFKDRSGDIIKCLWSPTNEDKTVKGYKVSAEGKSNAYLTVPSELAEGTTSKLDITGGSVTVDVTETPVYLIFSGKEKTIVNGQNTQLRPKEISLSEDKSTEVCDLTAEPSDSTLGRVYKMFDEPDSMPDPIYGSTAGMSAPSTSAGGSGVTAYAFFDKPCVFNGFSVYDTYGTGGISVYDAHTGKLLWSSDLGGYMYRAVTLTPDSAPTDCLKIVKEGGDMNELTFYGYEAPSVKSWDVDKDGRVDAFDLCLMRKSLIAGETIYDVADLVGLSRFLLGE